MFIRIIQMIALLIPLAGVYALIRHHQQSENTVRLTLTSFGCIVMNAGYLLTAIADNEKEAMAALKFEFFGNAVFFYFFITFLLSYLHIRMPRALIWGWAIAECAMVCAFWSEHLRGLFIGECSFLSDSSFHTFAVQVAPSPLYAARYVLLSLMLLGGVTFTLVRMLRIPLVSEKKNLGRLLAAQFTVLVSLLIQLLYQPVLDIMPSFASLSLLSLVISMLTDGFFGVTDSGHEWVFKQMDNAYVIADSLYGYLDANPTAKELFPELKKLQVNAPLPEQLRAIFNVSSQQFMMNKRTYSKRVTEIMHQQKTVGYGLFLEDITKQQAYLGLLNDYNTRLQSEVAEKTTHIQKVQNSIITGMASVVESRDNSTGGHINRTSLVVGIFSKALQAHGVLIPDRPRFLHNVRKAAPMHDIGKIAVDDVILRKPGKYTPEEYEIMKKHPAEGAKMLEKILREVDDADFVEIAVNIAHYHHERWDGTGYPEGLAGQVIPAEARIMALADVFDALVSKRCYKEAYSYDKAFEIIEQALGTQFDPALGNVFLTCKADLAKLYDSLGADE